MVVIQVISLMVWMIPCTLIPSAEDAATYLIPSISVLALFYAVMFILQIGIQHNYRLALAMKIIGPLFCIFMNNFKYGSYDNNMYGFLLGI